MKSSIKLAFFTAVAVAGIAACTSAKANTVVDSESRIGYGAIKLGMTLDEARAAGLTDLTWPGDGDDTCVADDELAISKRYGVVRISLPEDARTSTGIGVGSTFADVQKAYPNASRHRSGWSARVSDNVGYAFLGEDEVVRVKLVSRDADCSTAHL